MKDRRWIALCAIGLVVLAMMNLPDAASRRVKGAVRDGISPLQAGLRGGVRETRDVVRYVRGLGDLALENRALSEEIVYLRGEMRMAEELARDNRLPIAIAAVAGLAWIFREPIRENAPKLAQKVQELADAAMAKFQPVGDEEPTDDEDLTEDQDEAPE